MVVLLVVVVLKGRNRTGTPHINTYVSKVPALPTLNFTRALVLYNERLPLSWPYRPAEGPLLYLTLAASFGVAVCLEGDSGPPRPTAWNMSEATGELRHMRPSQSPASSIPQYLSRTIT